MRREVQKYAAKVQKLTDKVLSLQDELTQLRQQQTSQGEQFSDIRANLTEQRQLLNRALKSVENLTLQRGENGSILPEERQTHTGIARGKATMLSFYLNKMFGFLCYSSGTVVDINIIFTAITQEIE